MKTPLFIDIEAIDRGGKTTCIARAVVNLRVLGWLVGQIAYPDREAPITGVLIDDFLNDRMDPASAAALGENYALVKNIMGQEMFSLNRREVSPKLEYALATHQIVISSRYQLSGRVYGEGLGIPAAQMGAQIGALEPGLRQPDTTLVMDIDPQAVANRPRAGGLDRHERDFGLQERVAAGFRYYAQTDPTVILIDASGNEDQVEAALMAMLFKVYPELQRGPDLPKP
jgi:thymidylate kinase